MNYFHLGFLICAKLSKAMLLFLGLLGGANSTLWVSSINAIPSNFAILSVGFLLIE